MRMTVILEKGLTDPTGTSINFDKNVVGKVISYDKINGKAVVDVDDDVYNKLSSNNIIGISSRRM